MVEVVANTRGYIDGEIRETGEVFTISDALWQDEKRRPKWLDAVDARPVTAPHATKAKTKPKPAAAKAEQPQGNGVAEELGGPPPDWLPLDGINT
ncbi:hypothetical protein [Agrobacterium sp.]|uniref:hypothetical protein n=1 Tax=Agrobacterium sp. TaxID=361 RepID=UPI0028AACB2C|nr:hypothetical protein [Agrobacterium sp.]